jgi:hypothetical protein
MMVSVPLSFLLFIVPLLASFYFPLGLAWFISSSFIRQQKLENQLPPTFQSLKTRMFDVLPTLRRALSQQHSSFLSSFLFFCRSHTSINQDDLYDPSTLHFPLPSPNILKIVYTWRDPTKLGIRRTRGHADDSLNDSESVADDEDDEIGWWQETGR